MSIDLDEQYDKIYRYCYFKVHHREIAEDITQETFLRFLEHSDYAGAGKAMQYLYTIARNLCGDEYHRQKTVVLDDDIIDGHTEDNLINRLSVRIALSQLEEGDRELLLLRYVNEVPVSVICQLYGISRFAAYRRISKAAGNLRDKLGGEDFG